jgi:hypothetical protein
MTTYSRGDAVRTVYGDDGVFVRLRVGWRATYGVNVGGVLSWYEATQITRATPVKTNVAPTPVVAPVNGKSENQAIDYHAGSASAQEGLVEAQESAKISTPSTALTLYVAPIKLATIIYLPAPKANVLRFEGVIGAEYVAEVLRAESEAAA